MDAQVLTFAAVAALLTVTPGADMALVTRNALSGGRSAALQTTCGILLGCMAWAAASALGIAALLGASATGFTALKIVGAAYLVLLGLRTIWRARRAGAPARSPSEAERPGRGALGSSAFRQGVLTNLLNPKIAVFYSTLLPQFISVGDPVLLKSLLLSGIHGLMGLAWLSSYAWLVTSAGDVLRRPDVRRALDRVTGSVLVALGVRLAADRR